LLVIESPRSNSAQVLHDDADYRTVARHAPDLTEHSVRDLGAD
jgi:hypothetical protein